MCRVFPVLFFLNFAATAIYMAKNNLFIINSSLEPLSPVVFINLPLHLLSLSFLFFPFQHLLPRGQSIAVATRLYLTRGARSTVSFLPPGKAMSCLDTYSRNKKSPHHFSPISSLNNYASQQRRIRAVSLPSSLRPSARPRQRHLASAQAELYQGSVVQTLNTTVSSQ